MVWPGAFRCEEDLRFQDYKGFGLGWLVVWWWGVMSKMVASWNYIMHRSWNAKALLHWGESLESLQQLMV